jgi:hypothetical protein
MADDDTRGCRMLGAAAALLIAIPAGAHHSFAIFDHERTYTLTGTVRSFQWTNPHGYIDLDVDDGPAGIERFSVELTSVNMLRRAGWRSTDVEAGETVTAIVAPLLSGEHGGLLLELKTGDGRTLIPPVPAIETFKRTP